MKKTLPALICAAFLGTAAQAAQVDIFGAVDMYVGVNNAGGEWRTGLQSGGLTASHIGLKGTEDMGGGTQVSTMINGIRFFKEPIRQPGNEDIPPSDIPNASSANKA
mgnify:CR=1 FL=1